MFSWCLTCPVLLRIFWINIPICVFALVALSVDMNLALPESSFHQKLQQVDYLGICLFACSITVFLVGVTIGGTVKPWSSATTIITLVLGAFGAVVFVWVEKRIVKEPMIPMRIFSDRTAAAGYVGIFCHGFTISPFCYYIPLFVRLALHVLSTLEQHRFTLHRLTVSVVSRCPR